MKGSKAKIVVSGRIEPELEKEVSRGVKNWGMTFSEAIAEGLKLLCAERLSWKPIDEPKKKSR